jgi:hypothetical protein
VPALVARLKRGRGVGPEGQVQHRGPTLHKMGWLNFAFFHFISI